MIKNFIIKAVDGFEPTIKLLQSRALPLGYTALTFIIIPFKLNLVNSFFSENVSFPAFLLSKGMRQNILKIRLLFKKTVV